MDNRKPKKSNRLLNLHNQKSKWNNCLLNLNKGLSKKTFLLVIFSNQKTKKAFYLANGANQIDSKDILSASVIGLRNGVQLQTTKVGGARAKLLETKKPGPKARQCSSSFRVVGFSFQQRAFFFLGLRIAFSGLRRWPWPRGYSFWQPSLRMHSRRARLRRLLTRRA